MEHPLDFRSGIRIHVAANLAKYLPGYGWQVLGKAYLSRQVGVPGGPIAASMALELLSILVTGLLLVVLLFPLTPFVPLMENLRYVALSLAAVAAIAFLLLLPRLARWTAGKIVAWRHWTLGSRTDWNRIGLVILLIFLTWILLGAGFWFTVLSVSPLSFYDLPTCIFALALSFVISLAVILVPGGIGVRESAITFFLSTIVPAPTAAAIAILARLVLIVSEVLAFLLTARSK
jgi:uncharacterized membrane protein YbhN (UPF0104 family)